MINSHKRKEKNSFENFFISSRSRTYGIKKKNILIYAQIVLLAALRLSKHGHHGHGLVVPRQVEGALRVRDGLVVLRARHGLFQKVLAVAGCLEQQRRGIVEVKVLDFGHVQVLEHKLDAGHCLLGHARVLVPKIHHLYTDELAVVRKALEQLALDRGRRLIVKESRGCLVVLGLGRGAAMVIEPGKEIVKGHTTAHALVAGEARDRRAQELLDLLAG